MKKLSFMLLLTGFVLMGCSGNSVNPNGEVVYNHLHLNIDERDGYSYVGTVDYVFVGTVEDTIHREIDSDFPTMTYQVRVKDNLKGELVETVEVRKQGGYTSKGTLILNATDHSKDSGLPQLHKDYIFMAYAQPDGSLLLAEINGNTAITDGSLKEQYQEYIQNEQVSNRERFTSKYDRYSK